MSTMAATVWSLLSHNDLFFLSIIVGEPVFFSLFPLTVTNVLSNSGIIFLTFQQNNQ